MSLLTENVIPGNHGKIFGTNAIEPKDLEKIKTKILSLEGIKDVIINFEVFPREIIIHTIKMIKIKDILKLTDFHLISKDLFTL